MKSKKQILFKTLGMLLAVSLVIALSTAAARAAAYPSKPVRLLVPNAPGGGVDIVARLIAAKLSQRLGQQVIVENRGGANTVIGTEMAATAARDGYTLLMVATAFTANPALQKLPYDTKKAFVPIARLGSGVNALFVHPSVPANSVKEFIALAKQKPGQLMFASGGSGGGTHMSEELFMMMTGVDIKVIQFKGTGPAMTDLLGGHSHATIGMLLLSMPHIKAGKLKLLGTSGVKRSIMTPNVPTIAESGVPGYSFTGWYGMVAPAGTPAPIVDRLTKEIKTILALDEVAKFFLNQGAEVDYLSPTEFGTFLDKETTQWAHVVKANNIKLE